MAKEVKYTIAGETDEEYEIAEDRALAALARAGAAAQKAAALAGEAEVAEYEAKKPLAAQKYAESNAAAERAYRVAANPYGTREQRVRGAGLAASGYSETNSASIANEYQRGLGENRRMYSDELSQISGDIADSRRATSQAQLRAAADYNEKLADMEYKTGRDAVGDSRYEQEYADERADVLYKRQTEQSDKEYERQYTLGRDAVEDSKYAKEYSDTRADKQYERRTEQADKLYERQYTLGRDAIEDLQYAQEYADTRADKREENLFANATMADSRVSTNAKKLVEGLFAAARNPTKQEVRQAIANSAAYLTVLDVAAIKNRFGL